MERHKQQMEEEEEEKVGTAGRCRVGANPSVRKEEQSGNPEGEVLELWVPHSLEGWPKPPANS